jgi:2-oxoglutarate ferredoxin oxidoreductase subunit gamma
MRHEIILSGAGGQGLILAGAILAEAAGVFEGKEVVQTQSYGIQARGGASHSSVIISNQRILFPDVITPNILICLSQEAYQRFYHSIQKGGIMIIDQDLVKPDAGQSDYKVIALPFTAEAEKLNRRIVANVIALGALTQLASVVKPQSIAQTLPSRLPERNVPVALKALEIGVELAKIHLGVGS